MKKILLSMILILSIALAACTSEGENTSTEEENRSTEEENKSTKEEKNKEVNSESNSSPSEIEEKQDNNEDKSTGSNEQKENVTKDIDTIKKYKPSIGMKKTFIEDGDVQSFTEEFPYENGDYIQRVVKIGEASVIQIYKWTDKEISLVFEDKTPEDPNKNYLEDFGEDETIEILYSEEGSDWELIGQNETVEVPSGTYKNVYVIKKVSNEVEGEETIYTYYLAPEVGLIKETFELTGEQGYSAESILQNVTK